MEDRRIVYTLTTTVDDVDEVFNSSYYAIDDLIADCRKAEEAGELHLDELEDIEPLERPERE